MNDRQRGASTLVARPVVMAGLDPVIQALTWDGNGLTDLPLDTAWMAGSGPAMTGKESTGQPRQRTLISDPRVSRETEFIYQRTAA